MLIALQMLVSLGVPAIVLLTSTWLRSRERMRMLETVRALAEADKPLPVEVVQALPGSVAAVDSQRDLRRGVMLIAAGTSCFLLGLLAFLGYVSSGTSFGVSVATGMSVAAVGAIPLCIGAALVFLSRTDR